MRLAIRRARYISANKLLKKVHFDKNLVQLAMTYYQDSNLQEFMISWCPKVSGGLDIYIYKHKSVDRPLSLDLYIYIYISIH